MRFVDVADGRQIALNETAFREVDEGIELCGRAQAGRSPRGDRRPHGPAAGRRMTIDRRVSVPCLSLTLPGWPASVGEARRRVRAFAADQGAESAALARIELAVSEAAANAVVHAYAGRVPGPIWIEADVEDGELELVVADAGRGFTDQPAPGLGLGLALMRAGARDFEIRDRPQGGVELWACFALAS